MDLSNQNPSVQPNAFIGVPPQQTNSQPYSDDLQAMLDRLEGCEGLVEDELAEYSNLPTGSRATEQDYLVSIVIPVYNELNTIARVISRVSALPLNKEIVIVDDCSTDGTRELLAKLDGLPNVKLILKEKNAGKGAALRTGFENFAGDYVIVQDADLEYDPRDIPRVIEPLINGDADVVYGSRFIGEEQQDESWVHRAGNAFLTGASNLLNGLKLTDMETCYKAFSRDVIKAIHLEQERFGVEPEITAKLARRGFVFVEVPISYDSRSYAEGKKIGIRDLFNAIYCIGRYGMSD